MPSTILKILHIYFVLVFTSQLPLLIHNFRSLKTFISVWPGLTPVTCLSIYSFQLLFFLLHPSCVLWFDVPREHA